MCMKKAVNQERVRTWEAAGGAFCFIAGIGAGLLGSVLTASGWIIGAEVHPWIHAAGTALLIVTIPLILFAGFCLDWSERRPNKASDNDRDSGRGKPSSGPSMISKEIKRGVEEVRVTQDMEISLVPDNAVSLAKEDQMAWREIKEAVAQAGVKEDEEIGLIQCENGEGDHTFHKMRLGKALKLAENGSAKKSREVAEGCAG